MWILYCTFVRLHFVMYSTVMVFIYTVCVTTCLKYSVIKFIILKSGDFKERKNQKQLIWNIIRLVLLVWWNIFNKIFYMFIMLLIYVYFQLNRNVLCQRTFAESKVEKTGEMNGVGMYLFIILKTNTFAMGHWSALSGC